MSASSIVFVCIVIYHARIVFIAFSYNGLLRIVVAFSVYNMGMVISCADHDSAYYMW